MEKEKCIEILESLKNYAKENWDEEYIQDIQEAAEAVDMAVGIIKNSNVYGTMTLNGETYIISKE